MASRKRSTATKRRRVYDAFRLEGNASDEKVAAKRREKWLRAIAEYNAFVERHGTLAEFLDESPLRGSGLKARRSRLPAGR
jgi:hypothetical protein